MKGSYSIEFVVKDASGIQVGDGSDWVLDLAGGATANKEARVSLDVKGGKTCEVSKVD